VTSKKLLVAAKALYFAFSTISSRDKFKEQKEKARKERLKQNMEVECCEKI